jgi:hypothetical protein
VFPQAADLRRARDWSIRCEYLDNVIFFNKAEMYCYLKSFVAYYSRDSDTPVVGEEHAGEPVGAVGLFVPVVALLIGIGIVPEMSNALIGHFPTRAPPNGPQSGRTRNDQYVNCSLPGRSGQAPQIPDV